MSTRKTGWLRRVWCSKDFEDAMIRDFNAATKDEVIRLAILQKVVLIGLEDQLTKRIGIDGGTAADRAAALYISEVIEMFPRDKFIQRMAVNE